MRSCCALGAGAILGLLTAAHARAETPDWLKPPQLAVMTGFIKDPAQPQSLGEWQQGLGADFDAAAWVRAFRRAGAGYLIFYDKWIDGLVFHDTRTTSFKTKRDFLREVADACRAQGLPLVIYWNAAYDDNPEFAEYVTRDASGQPILFPEPWPCRLLSMHSPFRERAQQQVREILSGYGPISGLWLDCYSQPWPTTDAYTARAFEARYHRPPKDASPEQASEFVRTTLVEYLRELRAIAVELQPDLRFTYNGSADGAMSSPQWATSLLTPLGFLSAEGHSLAAMDRQAAAGSFLRRPMETGDLLSASWFSPPPPMPPGRARRAVAEAAVAWCQGANVYLALSPSHEGTLGEELEAVGACGDWLRPRRKLLADSTPWPDVGVVLGAPAPDMPGFPGLAQLWGAPVRRDLGAWGEAQRLCRRFSDLGHSVQVVYALGDLAAWPEDLSRFRALVLPERVCLDTKHLARLRQYVLEGGRMIALGHALLLEGAAKPAADFRLPEVLGLRARGEAKFPPETGPSVCYADSEYSGEWSSANLVDGTAAAWASADSPMPHWAQVNLPVAQPVARVRVTARQGGYILRDFHLLTWTGADWQPGPSIKDNRDRVVECVLDPPRTTLGVRVLVTAETYQGADRRLADIEEVEVFGPDGELLSRREVFPLKVRFDDGAFERAVSATAPPGPALLVEAEAAQVLATFADPSGGPPRPLLTRHSFGRGEAFWVAVGEASLGEDSPWWPALASLAAGPPGVSWEPRGRHRVILRRAGEALLLCAIDTQPDSAASPVQLRLSPRRLGLRGAVDPAADGASAKLQHAGRDLLLDLTPDPAATVVVR